MECKNITRPVKTDKKEHTCYTYNLIVTNVPSPRKNHTPSLALELIPELTALETNAIHRLPTMHHLNHRLCTLTENHEII